MTKGLFKSLVQESEGVTVAYPGQPYAGSFKIYPSKEPIELDMVFMVYTEKHRPQRPFLQFIKELGSTEQKRSQHEEINPMDETFDVDEMSEEPKDIPVDAEIEQPELEGPELDELPDRTHKEADAQLQQIAYDIDPVRKSAGFATLKDPKTTIKDIHKFIVEKRNLHAVIHSNSAQMPKKNEWVSIALHGYTDIIDKSRYQYNTRKWAKKWYTKKILETLYKSKGEEFDSRKKVGELFDFAWDQGWLYRDASDIMDGVEIEKA